MSAYKETILSTRTMKSSSVAMHVMYIGSLAIAAGQCIVQYFYFLYFKVV